MLTAIEGGRQPEKSNSRTLPYAARLAAAWEHEVWMSRLLDACAEVPDDPKVRAKLRVLAAFCRAHASRLLARLSALGRGPLPVPDEGVVKRSRLVSRLLAARDTCRRMADWYADTAASARAYADLSAAWVCELNRTECTDMANELKWCIEQLESAT